MKYFFLTLLVSFFVAGNLFAQEELMNLLGKDTTVSPYVQSTFKSSRLINLQSSETVYKRALDFRISHRFGAIGTSTNGTSSMHNLWGFDDIADVRIAFEYGITDCFTVGFSRSKYNENYEGLSKLRILRQRKDGKVPLSVTLFANASYSSRADKVLSYDNPSSSVERERRLSYTAQLILARKFSTKFSCALMPTYVHRNFTTNNQSNSLFALGGGFRYKIRPMTAVVVDYTLCESHEAEVASSDTSNPEPVDVQFKNPLGVGIEMETGGHVFTLLFTNAVALIEQEFIPNTSDAWSKGGFRFSFTISRAFHF